MNLLVFALVSVILATGVFNTEPKDSEGNKKTEIIVKESSKAKPAEAEAKAAAEAKAQAEAEAKAAAEAKEESNEIESSKDSEINYLRLALYIFGAILVISTGAYFYLRQRNNSSSRSETKIPDSSRRDFRKEVVVERQEEQPTDEEVKSELPEEQEQPIEEEVKSEPQEEKPPEDEKK